MSGFVSGSCLVGVRFVSSSRLVRVWVRVWFVSGSGCVRFRVRFVSGSGPVRVWFGSGFVSGFVFGSRVGSV